jgi:hypothetical protein
VTDSERHKNASKAVEALGLTMTTVVDDMDDSVSRAYDAFPDRLYVIDRDGRVAYAGGPGPRGLDPAAMKRALAKVVDNGGYAP